MHCACSTLHAPQSTRPSSDCGRRRSQATRRARSPRATAQDDLGGRRLSRQGTGGVVPAARLWPGSGDRGTCGRHAWLQRATSQMGRRRAFCQVDSEPSACQGPRVQRADARDLDRGGRHPLTAAPAWPSFHTGTGGESRFRLPTLTASSRRQSTAVNTVTSCDAVPNPSAAIHAAAVLSRYTPHFPSRSSRWIACRGSQTPS